MLNHAYIGFGSNLGDRNDHLGMATALLHQRAKVLRVATVVESVPVDGVDGDNFLNTVFECERVGDPHAFMKMLQMIEIAVGGKVEKLGGARTCDLDVLLWGNEKIDLPDLKVPHPRMHQRDFYLIPLCELVGEERHPVLNMTFSESLSRIELQSVIGQATD